MKRSSYDRGSAYIWLFHEIAGVPPFLIMYKRETLVMELKHKEYGLHLNHKAATCYWDQSENPGDFKVGVGTSFTDNG